MNPEVHSLIGAYAVDALTEAERTGFEHHLALCGACRAELVGLHAAACALASDSWARPVPTLRTSVLTITRSVGGTPARSFARSTLRRIVRRD